MTGTDEVDSSPKVAVVAGTTQGNEAWQLRQRGVPFATGRTRFAVPQDGQ
jgi:hypothetical protein